MSKELLPGSLVKAAWLAERRDDPSLVILDATIGQPDEDLVGIPRARRFDIDRALSDPDSPLPHTMPTPEHFQREVRALGVRQDSAVVAYDRTGIYSSPRAWWMFRAMGFDQVAVLDGGLPAWSAAGLPTSPLAAGLAPMGDFVAAPRPELVSAADRVMDALTDDEVAVIDARSEGRFLGWAPEPRDGLRPGHMPGAVNLPFDHLQDHGRMRPRPELEAALGGVLAGRRSLIASCGSGVTACIVALAADLTGQDHVSVYDGSWSEWGLPSSRPVVIG